MNKLQVKIDHAMMRLHADEIRFACKYADTGDIVETKRSLGLTKPQCLRMLEKDEVKKAIWYLQKQFQCEHGVSKAWKTEKLIGVIEEVCDTGSVFFNATAAVKAIHELNIMDGDIAATKVEHTGGIVMNVEYDIQLPSRDGMKTIEAEVIDAVGDLVIIDEEPDQAPSISARDEFRKHDQL